ncbi:unnamed protein product [Arctia plantaginis]|uniref:Chemosensory protein n=1 Tax=Arctia plantaginis TaxID=874455 RepID=A0A8S0ZSE3_ARCPL|nr:unnamed protein product [Arctia plantaginis]
MRSWLLLVCVLTVVVSCYSQHPNRYENFNADAIIQNDRILLAYYKCVMDKGPCTRDGKNFKLTVPVDHLFLPTEKSRASTGSPKRIEGWGVPPAFAIWRCCAFRATCATSGRNASNRIRIRRPVSSTAGDTPVEACSQDIDEAAELDPFAPAPRYRLVRRSPPPLVPADPARVLCRPSPTLAPEAETGAVAPLTSACRSAASNARASVLPETLATACGRCNPSQKTIVRKLLLGIRSKSEPRFLELLDKYNPDRSNRDALYTFLATGA